SAVGVLYQISIELLQCVRTSTGLSTNGFCPSPHGQGPLILSLSKRSVGWNEGSEFQHCWVSLCSTQPTALRANFFCLCAKTRDGPSRARQQAAGVPLPHGRGSVPAEAAPYAQREIALAIEKLADEFGRALRLFEQQGVRRPGHNRALGAGDASLKHTGEGRRGKLVLPGPDDQRRHL